MSLVRAWQVRRGDFVDVYGTLRAEGDGCVPDGHVGGVQVERVWLGEGRVAWLLVGGDRVALCEDRLVFRGRFGALT